MRRTRDMKLLIPQTACRFECFHSSFYIKIVVSFDVAFHKRTTTKHFISFEGRVLNIFRRFWEGAKFYGRILEYPPPPQYTYFMTGP